MRTIKKILKFLTLILGTLLILPVLLAILLYLPPVQDWAVQKATQVASEATGMQISLKRLRISFPLDIDLQELVAIQNGDTLLMTESIIVDLDLNNVLDGHVGVNGIDICGGKINTLDMIDQLRVSGNVGLLHLDSRDIDLKAHHAILSQTRLMDSSVEIAMNDTTIIDTTQSEPLPWTIDVEGINIRNTALTYRTPGDSMTISAVVKEASLSGADINLEKSIYKIKALDLSLLSAEYAQIGNSSPTHSLLIPNALAVRDLYLDTTTVRIKSVDLSLGESFVRGTVSMDFNSFTPGESGEMKADVEAMLKKGDIIALAQDMIDADIKAVIPERPIRARLLVDGNVDAMSIDSLHLQIPRMLDASAEGTAQNLLSADSLAAQLHLNLATGNLSAIKHMAGLDGINLPPMNLTANAVVDGSKYMIDGTLREGKGNVRMRASLNTKNMAYDAKMHINELNIRDFLPNDSIGKLNLRAEVKGCGTDFLAPATRMTADAELQSIEFNQWLISNLNLNATLEKGDAVLSLNSDNELLKALATLEAAIRERTVESANLSVNMQEVNLQALGIVKDSLTVHLNMQADASSDLKESHSLEGSIRDITLSTRDSVYHPMNLNFGMMMTTDTIEAHASAGDLQLNFYSAQGLDSLMQKIEAFQAEAQRQMMEHDYNQDTLQQMLPVLDAKLFVKDQNPLANLAKMQGFGFKELSFRLHSSPEDGVSGNGYLWNMKTSAAQIDTIDWKIVQDTTAVNLLARVRNSPKNRVVTFESKLRASFMPRRIEAAWDFVDAKGRKGMDIGLKLQGKDSTLTLSLTPLNPIIAYRSFNVNDDNYISISKDKRIRADIDLTADDGTHMNLYSTPNETALQDITLSLDHFNLGELSSVMPYIMPNVTGFLNGDVHAVQDSTQFSVSADMLVNNMTYEGTPLGNIGANLAYLPNSDGSQFVDAILSQNNHEILYLNGKYWEEKKEGFIDATATLNRLPMALANGFIPDNLARLDGYGIGEVKVTGSTDNPVINGSLYTDSFYIHSDPYSINLRIQDDSLKIKNSTINLDRIEAFSIGSNPLTLDGNIDFSRLDKITLDIAAKAKNFLLINAPKNRHSLAYGKAYVDVDTRVHGDLEKLNIDGALKVLGSTDVTYVMKDSPIAVDNQMSDLVTFVDFSDTLEIEEPERQSMDIRINMKVSLDEATTVHALLNEDGSDKIDIEGGGDLTFTYNALEGAKLFGRYTILSGNMNYSLVVVALKNFKIKSGSYIEFYGDILNPTISFAATERVKATVTESQVPRTVGFDVGLNVSRTLKDLGLEFTVEAPEDLTVQNELATMSPTQRGRVAITLLATGMYVTDNSQSSGGFNATGALSSFLQSEINNIAGKALSTIDVGFGIDNSTSAHGTSQTDYNFSFAKRFWGNRISVVIGGKVSSGNDVKNTGESIINNISVEYRLDNSGTRYVKAFYDRNYESLMEGTLTEIGAGLVFRKKTSRLGELFIFRNKKKKEEEK